MTEERFKYYTEGAPTLEEVGNLDYDYDNAERISYGAIRDIQSNKQKRGRNEFKTDADYKYYLFALAMGAKDIKAGFTF